MAEYRQHPIQSTPRDLALVYRNRDRNFKVYMAPMRDIIGGVLITAPNVLRERLKITQRYMRDGCELAELFPWDDELLVDENIAVSVEQAVRKKEGVYTLFRAKPVFAVPDMYLRGETLESNVKSKVRPKDVRSRYYKASITSPFLTRDGDINISHMQSTCPDFFHGTEKRGKEQSNTFTRCFHQSAMNREFYNVLAGLTELRRGHHFSSEDIGERTVYMPFAFAQNYARYDENFLRVLDSDLEALEYSAFVTYYFSGDDQDDHFDIDRRLFTEPRIYSEDTLRAIERGNLFREVIGQKPAKTKKEEAEIEAEEAVFNSMVRRLRDFGYHPEGKCLESGDNVAVRYENGTNAVSIVFSDSPMFYVQRWDINKQAPDPTGLYEGPEHPFSLLGRDETSYDDRTMRDTCSRIDLPSKFFIPETGFEPADLGIDIPQILIDRWKAEIKKTAVDDSHRYAMESHAGLEDPNI